MNILKSITKFKTNQEYQKRKWWWNSLFIYQILLIHLAIATIFKYTIPQTITIFDQSQTIIAITIHSYLINLTYLIFLTLHLSMNFIQITEILSSIKTYEFKKYWLYYPLISLLISWLVQSILSQIITSITGP